MHNNVSYMNARLCAAVELIWNVQFSFQLQRIVPYALFLPSPSVVFTVYYGQTFGDGQRCFQAETRIVDGQRCFNFLKIFPITLVRVYENPWCIIGVTL